jgi:hypothetical protein
METRIIDPETGRKNVTLARKCLALISDVAGRGARARYPHVVEHALQSLTQELLARIGIQEEIVRPASATELFGLESLLEELRWVDDASRDLSVPGWECDGFDHPN